jgi:hypothetical protein
MKRMLLLALNLALITHAQETTLESYQLTYVQKQKALVEQYGKDLESVLVSAQKKGDFDNYLILEAEKKRFDFEKSVPPPPDVKVPHQAAMVAYRQALIKLHEHYIKALDDFIKKSVMSSRIEDAKAGKVVKDEAVAMLATLTGEESVQPKKPLPEPKAKEEKPVLPSGSLFSTYAKDLVLYYTFDKNQGTAVKDTSAKQNHGLAEDVQFVQEGKTGGAASFNGSSARIVLNQHEGLLFGTGACSIGAWIKSVGTTRTYQSIFTKGANPGYAFRLAPSPDRAIEYFKSAGGRYSFFTSKQSIKDSEWHHVVVVDQGNGTVDFYMDGAFLESVKKTNYNTDTSEGAAIGSLENTGHGQWFNGLIDELFIFKRALTKSEIKRLYDQQNKK